MSNETQDLETTAIKALAVASKTPFKTAFFASLGVAVAQLVVLFTFFGGVAALITIAVLVLRS